MNDDIGLGWDLCLEALESAKFEWAEGIGGPIPTLAKQGLDAYRASFVSLLRAHKARIIKDLLAQRANAAQPQPAIDTPEERPKHRHKKSTA